MTTLLRVLLAAAVLLLALPEADAQRGRRPGSRSERSSKSSQRAKAESDFSQRLWYGAGGVLGFSGNNNINFAAVGLIPQVGYKFNNWLSAGPRVGVTYTTIKGNTTDGSRQRSNTWSYSGGVFGRARIFDFYAQTEVLALSNQYTVTGITNFGQELIVIDRTTGRPETVRETDTQWLIGAGYNAGVGAGLSSDFAIFYNLFDSVDGVGSPISLRLTLTYNY